MKRFVSVIISMALLISLVPTAFAASDEATQAAQSLYELGLFQGTGSNTDGTPNFNLDSPPTRAEGVTMLVRLLGKEDEAKNGTWDIPFTDVADWAKPYVGYAYAHGLTKGTSETTFSGEQALELYQYMTFILRALGYQDGVDFTWNDPWPIVTEATRLSRGDSSGIPMYYKDKKEFTRGDIAVISQNALYSHMKNSELTLGENLGIMKQSELTIENLQGVWQWKDDKLKVYRELIISENTLTNMFSSDYRTWYQTGPFCIEGKTLKWEYTNFDSFYGRSEEAATVNIDWLTTSDLFIADGSNYTKVAESTLYECCHGIVDLYNSEIGPNEKSIIASKMKDALENMLIAERSMQVALACDGQLLIGSIGGMGYSKRREAENGMQQAELAVMTTCLLIRTDIEDIRKILEPKAGTESLVVKLKELEGMYTTICDMKISTGHDQLMAMSDALSASHALLMEINDTILSDYFDK